MEAFLAWMESSALGDGVRGAGVWSYGLINLAHILGVATLFGAVLILDLRLLGWRRHVPLDAVTSFTVPAAICGFIVAVASGLCLLATNATEYIGNPFLLIKFVALPCALLNAFLLGRTSIWRSIGRQESKREPEPREHRQLALFGAVSLISWLIVISAGRMIGYW